MGDTSVVLHSRRSGIYNGRLDDSFFRRQLCLHHHGHFGQKRPLTSPAMKVRMGRASCFSMGRLFLRAGLGEINASFAWISFPSLDQGLAVQHGSLYDKIDFYYHFTHQLHSPSPTLPLGTKTHEFATARSEELEQIGGAYSYHILVFWTQQSPPQQHGQSSRLGRRERRRLH